MMNDFILNANIAGYIFKIVAHTEISHFANSNSNSNYKSPFPNGNSIENKKMLFCCV